MAETILAIDQGTTGTTASTKPARARSMPPTPSPVSWPSRKALEHCRDAYHHPWDRQHRDPRKCDGSGKIRSANTGGNTAPRTFWPPSAPIRSRWIRPPISSAIHGAGDLTKTGAETINLSGTNACRVPPQSRWAAQRRRADVSLKTPAPPSLLINRTYTVVSSITVGRRITVCVRFRRTGFGVPGSVYRVLRTRRPPTLPPCGTAIGDTLLVSANTTIGWATDLGLDLQS